MWLQLVIFILMSMLLMTAKNICGDIQSKNMNPVTVNKIKSFLTSQTLSKIDSGCDPSLVSSIHQRYDKEMHFIFKRGNEEESEPAVTPIQDVDGVGVLLFEMGKSFCRKRVHSTSVRSLMSNFSQGRPTGHIYFSNQEMQQLHLFTRPHYRGYRG